METERTCLRTDAKREVWNPAAIAEIRSLEEPGDADLVATLVVMFRDDSAAAFGELPRLLAGFEFEEIEHIAHRVKGAALHLGAERLADAAGLVEASAARWDASRLDAFVAALLAERERFFRQAIAG